MEGEARRGRRLNGVNYSVVGIQDQPPTTGRSLKKRARLRDDLGSEGDLYRAGPESVAEGDPVRRRHLEIQE